MIRVLAPEPLAASAVRIRLDPSEVRHLAVRRPADGEPVEVLDGEGSVGAGRLIGGDLVELERVDRHPRPVPLTLLVGAGDKDRFVWMVEKVQEVGVTRVVPVETERARNVSPRFRAQHLEKLRQRSREGLKQCGAPWLIELGEPASLDQALVDEAAELRWVADPAGGLPPLQLPPGTPAAVLVGPEGGLTDAERALALERGYLPLRLGPNTLRFETAAIAAAALLVSLRARQP